MRESCRGENVECRKGGEVVRRKNRELPRKPGETVTQKKERGEFEREGPGQGLLPHQTNPSEVLSRRA